MNESEPIWTRVFDMALIMLIAYLAYYIIDNY